MNGTSHCLDKIHVMPDVSPDEIAQDIIARGQQDVPFFIFNADDLQKKIGHWMKKMPRVEIFYAMKSNHNDNLLKVVVALGGRLDCASRKEIETALSLGLGTDNIIYTAPVKSKSEIKYANSVGVTQTVFDMEDQLYRIKEFMPLARLLLRFKVPNSVAMYNLNDKFGCDPNEEAVYLLNIAAELNLNVVGVAFHVGSACSSAELSFKDGIRIAHRLFEHETRAGRRMHIVDIGGGYMGTSPNCIDKIAEVVNKSLAEYFPDPSVRVIGEPGRYISDNAFTLYNNVNSVKDVYKEGELTKHYYLNEGIFGCLRYMEKWHVVEKLSGNADDPIDKCVLWGPTCDSTDVLSMVTQFPRCVAGDWLVFRVMGAYTITYSTSFSGMKMVPVLSVISTKTWNQIKNKIPQKEDSFLFNKTIATI